MWERASLSYIPSVHFMALTEKSTIDGGIWGPQRVQGLEPVGPVPPTGSPESDNYQWGVGEEADLITTSPIVDFTGMEHSNPVLNYQAGPQQLPQRSSELLMMTRMSKRLLRAMHHGQVSYGTYMPSKTYPASTALHHGLKVAAFPLPTFLDYAKSPRDIDQEFNEDNGKAVYSEQRQHGDIHHRMTYYSSMDKEETFADELYKRWLGYVSFDLLSA